MIFSFLAVFFFLCVWAFVTFCSLTYNSHQWPRQNFSLQYQNNIKQLSDENKDKYNPGEFLVDPIQNSLNHQDLPVRGLSCWHQWGLSSSISKKCFSLFCSVILAGYAQTWLDQKQQNLLRKVQLNFYFPHIYLLSLSYMCSLNTFFIPSLVEIVGDLCLSFIYITSKQTFGN